VVTPWRPLLSRTIRRGDAILPTIPSSLLFSLTSTSLTSPLFFSFWHRGRDIDKYHLEKGTPARHITVRSETISDDDYPQKYQADGRRPSVDDGTRRSLAAQASTLREIEGIEQETLARPDTRRHIEPPRTLIRTAASQTVLDDREQQSEKWDCNSGQRHTSLDLNPPVDSTPYSSTIFPHIDGFTRVRGPASLYRIGQ